MIEITSAPMDTKSVAAREIPSSNQQVVVFRDFIAYPTARILMLRDEPVCLGSRAFDLLMLLLASRGEVVSKAAIMAFVWPTTTVDESNLRFQMGVLRKALGKSRDVIKTIPGRGYLLAGDLPTTGIDATNVERARVDSSDLAAEGKREFRNAICALLDVVGRHSFTLPSVQTLMSEIMPLEPSDVLATSPSH